MNQLPRPSDYGLPENVEEAYKSEKKRYEENGRKIFLEKNRKGYVIALVVTYLICCCMFLIGDSVNSILELLFGSLACTCATTGFFIFLHSSAAKDSSNAFEMFRDSEFYKNYHKYKSAVQEYNSILSAQTQAFWLNQTGHEFEGEVAKVYQRCGYKAVVSKAGGDGGVDIVLTKDGERIAVQCKHHSKAVSPAVVRDLYGTILANGFSSGILVSLSGFTKGTIDFAIGKPIKLVDMKELILMSQKHK